MNNQNNGGLLSHHGFALSRTHLAHGRTAQTTHGLKLGDIRKTQMLEPQMISD